MHYFSHQKVIIYFLLLSFAQILPDPLYLNNANPYPLFSSQGKYDHFTRQSRETIRNFILYENTGEEETNIFHCNLMPYFQIASHGTNYEGKSSLVSNNNKNVAALPLDTTSVIYEGVVQSQQQQPIPNQNALTNIIRAEPMPLGAIPEPFNFFALFYPFDPKDAFEPQVYKTGELIQAEYCAINDSNNPIPECSNTPSVEEAATNTPIPSGNTKFNQIPKIVARYLGMTDVPIYRIDASQNNDQSIDPNSIGVALPNELMYDYSNYKNSYFGLLQMPQSRDPQKLFGYGYYSFNYKKFGIRSTLEWKIAENYGLKIYTGFSNLDIDQIKILDTTTNYQGPTAAYMFARYPDQIYQLSGTNPGGVVPPYVQPNIYQLTNYDSPVMDNTSNALFNSNFYNRDTLKNYLPDEFKTAYLQDIQNNLDSLGKLINQDFRPYNVQSFDDTTFELFYRRLIVYNYQNRKQKQKDENEEKTSYMPYTLLPIAAVHITVPIAPRTPGNKIFAKPLDNNGHLELGANLGLEFAFINNIAFGCDVGFSWYNSSYYANVPVPTNEFNEGIFLYSANFVKNPGYSYTIGLGMQVDKLFKCTNFFCEYRLVRHAEDSFNIDKMNNLLEIQYMENTHTSPQPDQYQTLDTIPNGILFLNYGEKPPTPTTMNVITEHMQEISSWSVQMLNITFNYEINEDMMLGFAYQQPISLRNAYNATTLGISFEMYI